MNNIPANIKILITPPRPINQNFTLQKMSYTPLTLQYGMLGKAQIRRQPIKLKFGMHFFQPNLNQCFKSFQYNLAKADPSPGLAKCYWIPLIGYRFVLFLIAPYCLLLLH